MAKKKAATKEVKTSTEKACPNCGLEQEAAKEYECSGCGLIGFDCCVPGSRALCEDCEMGEDEDEDEDEE